MKRFLLGLALGAAIWLFSPMITGKVEPWDAGSGYYEGALLGVGLLGGFLFPKDSRLFVAGIFAGQVLVMLGGLLRDPSDGGLWPLGVLFLAFYSVLALLGAMLGIGLRRRLSRHTP